MYRIGSLGLSIIILLSLCACSKSAPTWQEQYDLGIRYLSDGNYQEAIIAFTAAIEIDAMRPEAYLKAAEAYEAVDDSEAARAILEKGYAATGDESLRPQETQNEEVEEGENEALVEELWVMTKCSVFSPENEMIYMVNYNYNEYGFVSDEETYNLNESNEFEFIRRISLEYDYYEKNPERAYGTQTESDIFTEAPKVTEQELRFKGSWGGYGFGDPLWNTYVRFFAVLDDEDLLVIEGNGRWTYDDGDYSVYNTIDENGNPISVTTYSPDGVLTGTAELEWELIYPIPY